EPLLRGVRAGPLRLHERERALELLAAQEERELSFRKPLAHAALRLGAVVEPGAALVRRIDAAVPDDHLSGAVLARRDHALERPVAVGMVLGLHREPLFARI